MAKMRINKPNDSEPNHPRILLILFLVLAALIAVWLASSSRHRTKVDVITIDNLRPRLDVNGNMIDAHGGCLQVFNGRFYLYGNRLGTNRVDSITNCPFAVYTSPNLRDWTYEGDLLKNAPKGYYYRPYVVFNARTKKYVLWYNWYQKLWDGQEGVAVSDTPTGPFTIVNQKAHILGASPGDGSLFVDDDGTGYYIYTDIANDYGVRVERLTPDYLDSSGQGGEFVGYGLEAPLLFRRNNLYYVLCASLCADCPQGSESAVEVSGSPLGPYAYAGNINHNSGTNALQASPDDSTSDADLSDTNKYDDKNGYFHPHKPKHPFIRAQQTWVARVPTADGPIFIWMADGWKTARDGERGHDFQYWSAPLKFNPDGSIEPLRYNPSWTITWTMK